MTSPSSSSSRGTVELEVPPAFNSFFRVPSSFRRVPSRSPSSDEVLSKGTDPQVNVAGDDALVMDIGYSLGELTRPFHVLLRQQVEMCLEVVAEESIGCILRTMRFSVKFVNALM